MRVRQWRNASRALMVVGLLTVAVACGGDDTEGSGTSETTGDPIVLGAAVGQSGFVVPFDGPALQAAELAIADVNERGGLLGRPIELIVRDSRSDPAEGGKAAVSLVDEGIDMLIVTCDFDLGAPAATVAQDANLISMSLCAGSPKFGIEGIGDLAFTMGTASPSEGAILAEFASQEKDWTKAYVLVDTTIQYDLDLAAGFEERFPELGGEIVGKDTFQNSDPSIASQITRLRQSDAEFIFIASYLPGIAQAVRQIRAAGIDLPIVNGISLDGTFWLDAVPNLNDVFFLTNGSLHGDDPDDRVNEFVTRFERETGKPLQIGLNYGGYSVIEAYALAVERAESTETELVKAELEQFDKEELLIGETTFSPEYHISTTRPMRVMEIIDGTPTFSGSVVAPQKVPTIK